MIQDFKEDYCHVLPFVRCYFRKVIAEGLDMLQDIPGDSVVLDFGCGRQYLKKSSDLRIIGYDIISQFSDIEDYRNLKPDVIFCNHVLEHLDADELKETLANFKKMSPKFIITGLPTENLISRFCAMIGRPHGYFEHKNKLSKIHEELSKHFFLEERRNVMTLTIISKWR